MSEMHILRNAILGVDFGTGALKIYGRWGGIELPAHGALGRRQLRAVIGALRTGDTHRVLVDEGIDDDQMADDFEGWLR